MNDRVARVMFYVYVLTATARIILFQTLSEFLLCVHRGPMNASVKFSSRL